MVSRVGQSVSTKAAEPAPGSHWSGARRLMAGVCSSLRLRLPARLFHDGCSGLQDSCHDHTRPGRWHCGAGVCGGWPGDIFIILYYLRAYLAINEGELLR